jgi:hypothetical protein
MQRHIVIAIALSLLTACGPGPDPIPTPVPIEKETPAVNTKNQQLERDIQEKILDATTEQYEAQRVALRELRKGGQIDPTQWPGCSGLEKSYIRYIEDADTLIAIQEALLAAEIDDHVVCDVPSVFPAAKAAAINAQRQFMGDANPDAVINYLVSNPARRKMDQCWLNGLREARQHDVDYDKAFAMVQDKCSGSPVKK